MLLLRGKKKPTSLSNVAEAFRRSLVLIETPEISLENLYADIWGLRVKALLTIQVRVFLFHRAAAHFTVVMEGAGEGGGGRVITFVVGY